MEAAHIPEILREAGPGGLHVEEIARRVGEVRRGRRKRASSGLEQTRRRDSPFGEMGEGSSGEDK